MGGFQDSKIAKVIRILAPAVRGDELQWVANWAIVWTLLLFLGPLVLFEKSIMHSPLILLVVICMLALVGGLMILIGAAHGCLSGSGSSLTKAERAGAKQPQKTKPTRR
jgi:hypothetical protein